VKTARNTETDHSEVVQASTSNLREIAAAVGVATAALIFLAFYFSSNFARGLFLSMGFPPSLVSFRTAIDMFPEVGIQYSSTLCGAVAGGFFFARHFLHSTSSPQTKPRRSPKFLLGFVLLLLFSIVAISTLEITDDVFELIVVLIVFVGPMSVGFCYRMIVNPFMRMLLTALALFSCCYIYAYHLYMFGKNQGEEVMASRSPTSTEGGLAVFKTQEFPVVSVVSEERLAFLTTPREFYGKGFMYEPSTNAFIRLIVRDGSNTYFLEHADTNVRAIAISNDRIGQILFKTQSSKGKR
jgi:hypothetical protein